MKGFLFTGPNCIEQKTRAESLLRSLYSQLKEDLSLLRDIEEEVSPMIDDDNEDIFAKM